MFTRTEDSSLNAEVSFRYLGFYFHTLHIFSLFSTSHPLHFKHCTALCFGIYFTYFNCKFQFYIYDFYSICFLFSDFVYFDRYAPQHKVRFLIRENYSAINLCLILIPFLQWKRTKESGVAFLFFLK